MPTSYRNARLVQKCPVGSGGVCTVDDVVEFLSWVLSVHQAGSAVEAVPDGLDGGIGDLVEAGAGLVSCCWTRGLVYAAVVGVVVGVCFS